MVSSPPGFANTCNTTVLEWPWRYRANKGAGCFELLGNPLQQSYNLVCVKIVYNIVRLMQKCAVTHHAGCSAVGGLVTDGDAVVVVAKVVGLQPVVVGQLQHEVRILSAEPHHSLAPQSVVGAVAGGIAPLRELQGNRSGFKQAK